MSNLDIIKLATLTVGLQAILVLVSFLIYYGHEKISKRNLLHRKKEINEGMIWDKEVEIESNWILLRQAEDKTEAIKKEIKENEDEIKIEKEKTPMDLEKTKDLRLKNIKLGYNGKLNPDGSFKYEATWYDPDRAGKDKTGRTSLSKVENETEAHHSKITTAVMEREYLKVQLQAIIRLIKKGYAKSFDRFEEKELRKGVLENLKKK